MGKIQKIKAQRKLEKIIKEEQKKKTKKIFLKSVIIFFVALVLVAGVFFGYKTYPFLTNDSNQDTTTTTKPKQYNKAPEMSIDVNKKYTAVFKTNKGEFTASLDTTNTPKTVNNFIFLAKDGFYDDLTFHRIIKDFMIQGGDPKGDGTGGPGYKFDDEQITGDYNPGTLAMANSGENTNGSQFFIMTGDYSGGKLAKDYVIFGEIISGMDVVQKIAETPVEKSSSGESSKPTEKIIIESIMISESV